MAATNECLAKSNKPRTGAKATKKQRNAVRCCAREGKSERSASTGCFDLTGATVLSSSRAASRYPLNGALRRSQTDGSAISPSDLRNQLSRELPLRLAGRRRSQQI